MKTIEKIAAGPYMHKGKGKAYMGKKMGKDYMGKDYKYKMKMEQEKKASDGLAKARYAAKHYMAKGQPEKAKSIIQRVSKASGKQIRMGKGGVAY